MFPNVGTPHVLWNGRVRAARTWRKSRRSRTSSPGEGHSFCGMDKFPCNRYRQLLTTAPRNTNLSEKPRKLADRDGMYLLVNRVGKYWRHPLP